MSVFPNSTNVTIEGGNFTEIHRDYVDNDHSHNTDVDYNQCNITYLVANSDTQFEISGLEQLIAGQGTVTGSQGDVITLISRQGAVMGGQRAVPDPVIYSWDPAGGIPDYIRTLYLNILDREPENQLVLDNWTNATRSNGVASTITSFFNSAEFAAKNHSDEVIVDKLYRAIQYREGERQGKRYWLNVLRHGTPFEEIVNICVRSEEYKRKVLDNVVPHPWPASYNPSYTYTNSTTYNGQI